MLHGACAQVLAKSFEGENADAMALSHSFIVDLDKWLGELSGRPEAAVLRTAAREYQFALLALSRGDYRAAYGSLRLSLELIFAGIRWSTNERELREWRRGSRDSVWAELIDKDNGVLSRQFVSLFTEPLAEDTSTYRAAAATVYRECSEYVHGNAHTHETLPMTLEFAQEPFQSWHDKASVVRLVTSFALAARFLCDIPREGRNRIESVLLAHLGHSPAIRALLGATVEASDD